MSGPKAVFLKTPEPLRLGFMPVADCAPLVYTQEAGVFEKYGLDIELHRGTSWANIRDKVINGDLDAAHAPAMLPFLANLGLDSDPCSCVSGMVLSLQGNAETGSGKGSSLGQTWVRPRHYVMILLAHIPIMVSSVRLDPDVWFRIHSCNLTAAFLGVPMERVTHQTRPEKSTFWSIIHQMSS